MIGAREIRTRITSVKNIKKITKAMEMVAASKMRKSKNYVVNSRSYSYIIRNVIDHFSTISSGFNRSYFKEYKIKRIGYLVVSTNRGLCGGLNTNLFKHVLKEVKAWLDKGVQSVFIAIGSKSASFLESLGANIILQIVNIENNLSFHKRVVDLTKTIIQAYNEDYLDKLYIVNNKFIDIISQTPTVTQLLPFSSLGNNNVEYKHLDYLYESDPKILLDALLYRYIESQIYQGVLENLASEQAARMVAMKTATDNSETLIKDLQLTYNKARQTSITRELIEIVSGNTSKT